MKRLADQIKQALNALAFADIGEPIGRRAQYAALNPGRVNKLATPVGGKLIALGVGASLPKPVMTYVIGACRRMHADLLLLSEDAGRVRELLAEYLPDLKGIHCQTEELPSASRRALVEVLRRRSNVLFAVTGTPDDPVHALLRGRRGLLEAKTPVPVVMVGQGTPKTNACPAGLPRLAAH